MAAETRRLKHDCTHCKLSSDLEATRDACLQNGILLTEWTIPAEQLRLDHEGGEARTGGGRQGRDPPARGTGTDDNDVEAAYGARKLAGWHIMVVWVDLDCRGTGALQRHAVEVVGEARTS